MGNRVRKVSRAQKTFRQSHNTKHVRNGSKFWAVKLKAELLLE